MNSSPNSPTKSLVDSADRRKTFNEEGRRKRRDIARDVWAAYRAVASVAGFDPADIRTAEAITLCHWEVAGQDYDKPRPIKLLLIGGLLSSRGKTDEGKVNTASNRTSQLFTEAQPRAGYQLHTRYKAVEDNRPHEYVDHILPVAEMVAELHAAERRAILSDNQPRKQARIAEALERLAAEQVALGYLPACDAELVNEDGEVYAYLSDAEAKTYSAKNPNFKAQAKTARPKRRFSREDEERLTLKIRNIIEDILDDFVERNGLPDANKYSVQAQRAIYDAFESWRKQAPARQRETEECRELIHVPEFGGQGVVEPAQADAETGAEVGDGAPQCLGGKQGLSGNDCNTEILNSAPEPPAEPAFYSTLEAAMFYRGRGFPVLPVCQSKPGGGCTWAKHPATCKSRKPLVWADDKDEGEGGYRAATLDRDRIREWFEGKYRDQGVAIRTDGKAVIDCDVKDDAGGLESYAILKDTFGLEETLTQITHSGGRHYVFNLPEGLPDRYLKSWVRVGNKVGLPGIDLKVDKWGLLFVEPTAGPMGSYKWGDLNAPIATLPRKCCDFLREARYTQTPEEKAKAARASARVYSSSESRQFDSDQSKYFRDVPEGDRHARVLTVLNAAYHAGANSAQLLDVGRYHAARFSSPLSDEPWLSRTVARMTGGAR